MPAFDSKSPASPSQHLANKDSQHTPVCIRFDDSLGFWVMRWNAELPNETLKVLLLECLHEFEQRPTSRILVDERQLVITDEPFRQWHAENIIAKVYALGLRKMALIRSHDLFTQENSRLTLQAGPAFSYPKRRYFDSEAEALAWLAN